MSNKRLRKKQVDSYRCFGFERQTGKMCFLFAIGYGLIPKSVHVMTLLYIVYIYIFIYISYI